MEANLKLLGALPLEQTVDRAALYYAIVAQLAAARLAHHADLTERAEIIALAADDAAVILGMPVPDLFTGES